MKEVQAKWPSSYGNLGPYKDRVEGWARALVKKEQRILTSSEISSFLSGISVAMKSEEVSLATRDSANIADMNRTMAKLNVSVTDLAHKNAEVMNGCQKLLTSEFAQGSARKTLEERLISLMEKVLGASEAPTIQPPAERSAAGFSSPEDVAGVLMRGLVVGHAFGNRGYTRDAISTNLVYQGFFKLLLSQPLKGITEHSLIQIIMEGINKAA